MNWKFWQWETTNTRKLRHLEYEVDRLKDKFNNLALLLDYDEIVSNPSVFGSSWGAYIGREEHSIDLGGGTRRRYSTEKRLSDYTPDKK